MIQVLQIKKALYLTYMAITSRVSFSRMGAESSLYGVVKSPRDSKEMRAWKKSGSCSWSGQHR